MKISNAMGSLYSENGGKNALKYLILAIFGILNTFHIYDIRSHKAYFKNILSHQSQREKFFHKTVK